MKAQICPKCNGQGITMKPPWVAGDQYEWTSTTVGPYTCNLCNGAMVIYILDDAVSKLSYEYDPDLTVKL